MRARRVTVLVLAFLLVGAVSATAGTLWGTYQGYAKVKLVANGSEKTFEGSDVPPFIVDNTTVMPLRTMVEEFGLLLKWDSDQQTVNLFKPNVHMATVREVSKKNGDYLLTGAFGEVAVGDTIDFVVFIQVDNLKTAISSLEVSVYDPYGSKVTSTSSEAEAGLTSFWYPVKMAAVNFNTKGNYTVRLSFNMADSGSSYTVSEKQIVVK
jgi:Copper amine oxidase N-terminal domain